HKLNALQLDPGLVTSTPVTSAFDKLTQGGDGSLSAVFVLSGEVDFVAEDNHHPICTGARIAPFGVLRYSQYCSKVFKMNSGVVVLEKLRLTISMSGSLCNALKRVIVFPEPGGPQSIRGLCSDNQEYNTSSWRTVSIVGTTMSEDVTEWRTLWTGIQSPVVEGQCRFACARSRPSQPEVEFGVT
ncbi:hypothetical protein M405DRAFT_909138, partial [Rhizopogon salebrosus TDB-379]